jgi:hypothetical protein
VRTRHRRELGRRTQTVFALSTRRVSGLMMINRSTMNYRSRRDPQHALRVRMRELGGEPGALRLPASDGDAQTRRLGGARQAHLSVVHRGRTCSAVWLLKTWSERARECSAGAMAMPELHAASFVSEERRRDGYPAFSLNRQALRRMDALRASCCHGAERIAD